MKSDDTQSCPEIRDWIPLYVGGDLDPEALEDVRTHLDDCDACARYAGDASRARQVFMTSFREREAASSRPDLWSGIRHVLVEEGRISTGARPAETSTHEQRRPRLRLVRYAGSFAAAAAVVVFASLHLLQGPKTLDVIDSSPVVPAPASIAVAEPDVNDVSTTGVLSRVEPGEESLLGTASELRYVDHPQMHPGAPGVPLQPQLVRLRRN